MFEAARRSFAPERLLTILISNKMSVSQLRKKYNEELDANVSISYIRARVLGVTEPSVTDLATFADVFGVPIDFFFTPRVKPGALVTPEIMCFADVLDVLVDILDVPSMGRKKLKAFLKSDMRTKLILEVSTRQTYAVSTADGGVAE